MERLRKVIHFLWFPVGTSLPMWTHFKGPIRTLSYSLVTHHFTLCSCSLAEISGNAVRRFRIKHNGITSKLWLWLTWLSSLWFPYRAWYLLYLPWRYLLLMKRLLSSLQLEGDRASLGGTLAAQKLLARSLPITRNNCDKGRVNRKINK